MRKSEAALAGGQVGFADQPVLGLDLDFAGQVNANQDFSKLAPKVAGQDAPRSVSIGIRRCVMEKKASCDCGWEFQTDNDDKLVQAVQEHDKTVHNMDGVTREQALSQAKPV